MRRDPRKWGAIVGGFSGLLVAAGAMCAAWQHDSHGEIHGDFGVDWGFWLLLGFSWFVPVSLAVGLVSGAVARMLRPR